MKIIYTTADDFLKQEIDEYGEEYVDHQFALGYEPGLVTALGSTFYTWVKVQNVSLRLPKTHSVDNHILGGTVSFSRPSVVTGLSELTH